MENGLQVFADHEALEMLLYFAIPRVDTNETAHRLKQQFGSLHKVFEAPIDQLMQVEGIGLRSAQLIKLVHALIYRYQTDARTMRQITPRLNSTEAIAEYFVPQFLGEREEVLLVAYVDGTGRVLKCEECGRGGHSHVAIDSYQIVRSALLCQAQGVVLAHNHPDGVASPSKADHIETTYLRNLLSQLRIELVDHCIVAGERCVSMRKMNWLEGRGK